MQVTLGCTAGVAVKVGQCRSSTCSTDSSRPSSVAIIYSYRLQIAQYRYLLYGGGGLFLMGLGIRAMPVGAR